MTFRQALMGSVSVNVMVQREFMRMAEAGQVDQVLHFGWPRVSSRSPVFSVRVSWMSC